MDGAYVPSWPTQRWAVDRLWFQVNKNWKWKHCLWGTRMGSLRSCLKVAIYRSDDPVDGLDDTSPGPGTAPLTYSVSHTCHHYHHSRVVSDDRPQKLGRNREVLQGHSTSLWCEVFSLQENAPITIFLRAYQAPAHAVIVVNFTVILQVRNVMSLLWSCIGDTLLRLFASVQRRAGIKNFRIP